MYRSQVLLKLFTVHLGVQQGLERDFHTGHDTLLLMSVSRSINCCSRRSSCISIISIYMLLLLMSIYMGGLLLLAMGGSLTVEANIVMIVVVTQWG